VVVRKITRTSNW